MSSRICKKLDENVYNSGFLNSFDYVLCDCDGVLWWGNAAIPGSPETIRALKDKGKRIMYVTNNSSKSREEYVKKFTELGFPATLDDIVTTSYVAALYLQSLNFQKKVYIFGSSGIANELDNVGIKHLSIGPDPIPGNWIQYIKDLKLDPDVGAVVVGFDEHISYPKLTKAASYLKNPDCLFIATNTDEQFPTESNLIIPGTGTFVAALEAVSGRKAVSLGKPTKHLFDFVKGKLPELDSKRCIMIGDRLNTDILFGTSNDLKTLLVLTGVSNMDEVRNYEQSSLSDDKLLVPDFYLPCLGDLGKLMEI